MPWTTLTGTVVPFPVKLWTKLATAGRPKPDVMTLLDALQRQHEALLLLDAEARRLQNEVNRLEHENRFMLRIIDARSEEAGG